MYGVVYLLIKLILVVLRPSYCSGIPLCTLHVTRHSQPPQLHQQKSRPGHSCRLIFPPTRIFPFLLGFSANSKISLARTYPSHLHRLRCLEFTRSSDKLFILLVTYLSFHTITECVSSHKSLFSRLQRVVHLHLTPAPGGSFPLLDLAKEILPL